jgi:hypothetical protein
MTRKEIENSLAYNASKQAVLYSQEFSNDDILQGEVIEAYELGADFGYNFAVDKVCEWLRKNYPRTPEQLEGHIDWVINNFKKTISET